MKLKLGLMEFDLEDPKLDEGEFPSGVVVLIRTSLPDNNTRLVSMCDGVDWLTVRGMLQTADEMIRDQDEEDKL